jgi:hypothetical protein
MLVAWAGLLGRLTPRAPAEGVAPGDAAVAGGVAIALEGDQVLAGVRGRRDLGGPVWLAQGRRTAALTHGDRDSGEHGGATWGRHVRRPADWVPPIPPEHMFQQAGDSKPGAEFRSDRTAGATAPGVGWRGEGHGWGETAPRLGVRPGRRAQRAQRARPRATGDSADVPRSGATRGDSAPSGLSARCSWPAIPR